LARDLAGAQLHVLGHKLGLLLRVDAVLRIVEMLPGHRQRPGCVRQVLWRRDKAVQLLDHVSLLLVLGNLLLEPDHGVLQLLRLLDVWKRFLLIPDWELV